ncbi:MAG: hypothetical protein ACRDGT_07200 [Candidatus Limnocylindria bacterium]
MKDKDKEIPKNQAGQPPTRTPDETEERLEEKERGMRGKADRLRTEDQIDEVRTKP